MKQFITFLILLISFNSIAQEEKKNFFNGGTYSGYSAFKMGFASVKKLKFFQKLYRYNYCN